jgi:ATP-dependent DNA ligase
MRPYRGRRNFDISDPIVEPLWSGVRVIAHVKSGEHGDDADAVEPTVALIEELGADLAPELPEVATALGRSLMATSAVIDGIITTEVGLEGIGADAIPEVRASSTGMLMRNNAELDVVRRGPTGDKDDADVTEGIVAVDLLAIDGSSLLDVPLLERKRLLESVIRESELVRVSVHARPPFRTWISTWKALGLRGAMLKAANSRYQPGTDSIEWRPVESMGRRG